MIAGCNLPFPKWKKCTKNSLHYRLLHCITQLILFNTFLRIKKKLHLAAVRCFECCLFQEYLIKKDKNECVNSTLVTFYAIGWLKLQSRKLKTETTLRFVALK